jgi:nitrate reductase delta subunit
MLSFRVLSALLLYPTPDVRAAAQEGVHILREERLLTSQAVSEVCGFVDWLLDTPQLDVEASYIDAFDRGRSTSLHLFEHVHGDSRERGEAMLKLLLRYRAHGLEMQPGELPDFLPLFLEFLSTRPSAEAGKHLAEVADIIALIGRRLRTRGSPYAPLLSVVAALTQANLPDGGDETTEERDDTPAALDAAWEEAPVTFNDAASPTDPAPRLTR